MDITQLILTDHAEFRRLFLALDEIDRGDTEALRVVWMRLRDFLDVHAEAEERFFYPKLLKVGEGGGDSDSAADETEDAIEDHNEIRDTAKKVDGHPVGSEAWFEAIDACNKANSDHMGEEERQGLADFRLHASLEERHALAVKFIAFEAGHRDGIEPVDKDPKAYVAANA